MTEEELEEIRARVEAATPPPWTVTHAWREPTKWSVDPVAPMQEDDIFRTKEDAEFVAYARDDIPKLLAEVERLQGELRAAAGCVAEVLERCGVLPGCVEELSEKYGNLKLSQEEE